MDRMDLVFWSFFGEFFGDFLVSFDEFLVIFLAFGLLNHMPFWDYFHILSRVLEQIQGSSWILLEMLCHFVGLF